MGDVGTGSEPHLPWIVAAPFAVSGVVHLVRPEGFERIVPTPLQAWARPLVIASGVAELMCAAGLVVPTTRRAAGVASAALLLAVWPANAQMSLDLGRRARKRQDAGSIAAFAVSLARLPLQVPLIRSALRAR
ncbi:DoxX family protein [Serinibacter arcticus]|uniref:DoxX family protein n=1 Tax=Serinibacter arcticus TaxID=1655435 RepID=A0A2U1ZVT4_9MICO|nr:MauE/DoxX family redox-associated membrane protein [Serinibacter arcticus]PWD51096.1 DoxX family protein [Serinibacter arcticus]